MCTPPLPDTPRLPRTGTLQRRVAAALAGCVILLMAACATPSTPPPLAPSTLPDRYSVSGRIAVNADGQGYNARFVWQHAGTTDQINIENPLGQIVARLEIRPGMARFLDADGRPHDAEDIETLTAARLGWRLPVLGMRYWLLGLPDPTRPAQVIREPQQHTVQQDGWQIRYATDTASAGTGADTAAARTPSRITLTRPDLEVRIALYDWQLDNRPAPRP